MHRSFLAVCLMLLVSFAGQAQTPKNPYKYRSVGVSIGWQNFRFLDRHASPLAYGTNSIFPSFDLSFSRQTDASNFHIKVSGAIGQANPINFGARNYKTKWSSKDSFQYQIASTFIHANIEGSYMRNIRSLSTSNLQYWVGGSVNESAYYASEVANMPWMFNTLDLSPAVQVNYAPYLKHNLGIRIDLAAIGLVTRQVYALFPKSDRDRNVPAYVKQGTRLATPGRFFKGSFQLMYQYQVTKHFAVGAQYRTRMVSHSAIQPLHALDRHFDINFAYTY